MVGLEGRFDTPILRLSSGERRRLALASAYMRSPSLLLVDEPTVGLDPWNAARILELLVELASKGAGVVVATHSPGVGGIASKVVEV
jgi:energy-coupling factor transport system ATP-binding protein